jgi:hypothetical protein
MRPLTQSALMAVWDMAVGLSAARRALALLAAACPDESPDALAQLSVGRRDARLLTLREWAFGAQIESLTDCPRCGECTELSFPISAALAVGATSEAQPAAVVVRTAERELRFRLPDSLDLEAMEAARGVPDQVAILLSRCRLPAGDGEPDDDPDPLPEDVVTAVAARMAEADPQADLELPVSCSGCRHDWLVPFDIAQFVWSEVDAWARRTLHDVHALARAYGWREADVLSLSPRRRQLYLEMIDR